MVVENSINQYDVVVVGAGAAGLTAALYSSRRGLKTLVVTTEVGGQAGTTMEIENYPGAIFTTGPDLMTTFKKQADNFGAEFLYSEINGLEKQEEIFVLKTNQKDIFAKSVILAFGLSPKKIGLVEEVDFLNKGLSYCATCDGPLFKNKKVAIVGGGPAGLEAADYLASVAEKVYLVVRGEKIIGEAVVQDKINNNSKIEIFYKAGIKKIIGTETVEKIIISKKEGEQELEQEVEVQGIFVKIGYMANSAWLPDFIKRDDKGQIITNKDTETSCVGVYAAGDITDTDYKQVVVSAGEGAKAALRAFQYIQKIPRLGMDWGSKK